MAVIPSSVPANLKSMSPTKSSVPLISVRISSVSHSFMRPIAIPLTGFFIGTHHAMSARVEPHTEAIEVDPPAPNTSETILIV